MAEKKVTISEGHHTFLKTKAAKEKTTIQQIVSELINTLIKKK